MSDLPQIPHCCFQRISDALRPLLDRSHSFCLYCFPGFLFNYFLFWFTFLGLRPLFSTRGSDLTSAFLKFSSFHGWLDWRGFHPDSRAHWRKFPFHHRRHPLSSTDYNQTVVTFPIGARVFPCLGVFLVSTFASGLFLYFS